jgi:hypothetical protein
MRDEPAEEENAETFRRVMAAGTLGLAMAEKAVEILDRYLDREQLTRVNTDGTVDFDCRIPAPDGPVFTAILEAAPLRPGSSGRPSVAIGEESAGQSPARLVW